MRNRLRAASHLAVVATFVTAIAAASAIGAQPNDAVAAQATPEPSLEIISQAPASPAVESSPEAAPAQAIEPALPSPVRPATATTLAGLVSAQPFPADLPRELNCLAGAIYFEAKSESLSGQLAVGRVVVARSKSGRFPNSYCGVVFQPSQFSFVRGGGMPGIARASRQWRNAVAIAQIAHEGSWRSPVEGALFFHAAHVSPGWRLRRVARLENHIFYR